jgi:hypothetical protein
VFGEKKFNLVVTPIYPPLGDIKVLSRTHPSGCMMTKKWNDHKNRILGAFLPKTNCFCHRALFYPPLYRWAHASARLLRLLPARLDPRYRTAAVHTNSASASGRSTPRRRRRVRGPGLRTRGISPSGTAPVCSRRCAKAVSGRGACRHGV